jgi:hypothetical protein
MPERLINPSPSVSTHLCRNCHHWLRTHTKEIVILPTGGIVSQEDYEKAVRTAIGLGEMTKLPSGAKETTQAPCTRFPQWVMQCDDSWCGEFEAVYHTITAGHLRAQTVHVDPFADDEL